MAQKITKLLILASLSVGSRSAYKVLLDDLANPINSSGPPKLIKGSVTPLICSLVMSAISSGKSSSFAATTPNGFVL